MRGQRQCSPCCSPAETNCEVFDCTKKWREDLFVTWSGYYTSPASGDEAIADDMVNGSATLPWVGAGCTWRLILPATFDGNGLDGPLDVEHHIDVILGGGPAVPQFRSLLQEGGATYDWTDCFSAPQTSFLSFTGGAFGVFTTQTQAHWTVDCNARTATWDNPAGTGAPGSDTHISTINGCPNVGLFKRLKLVQAVINF